MKKLTLKLTILAIILITLAACGNEFSGTWEGGVTENKDENDNKYEYTETLVLSGKSFTLTQFTTSRRSYDNPSYVPDNSPPPLPAVYVSAPSLSLYTNDERDNAISIREWTTGTAQTSREITEHELLQITSKGTFSVTDNKIEFILSDNTVKVFDIEYTENTMRIGHISYTRQGKKR